jgi:hypothetical protein
MSFEALRALGHFNPGYLAATEVAALRPDSQVLSSEMKIPTSQPVLRTSQLPHSAQH